MKLFKKKEKGIKLINDNYITHLVINGVDISQYILAYEIKQNGGEKPKLVIEIMPDKIDIISKQLEEIKIKIRK